MLFSVDSLSGTEEQGDIGSFEYSHMHNRHGNTPQEQYAEARSDSMKSSTSDCVQNEYRSMKSATCDSMHNEYSRSMEITTKPLTKMFTSMSALPVSNIPQVQLVSPVAVGEHEPQPANMDGKNIWRKEIYHSADMLHSYNEYEHLTEEKYQPDVEKAGYRGENEPITIIKSCRGNEDMNDAATDCEEHHQLEKQSAMKESCVEAQTHQELEILILQTKLENERREHKLRIQLLRQQLKFWKKKTMNQK